MLKSDFCVFVSVLALSSLSLMSICIADDSGGTSVLNVAHRGASGYVPEHTLSAFTMAHAMGADYWEFDLVLTKDGVPVVIHGRSLEDLVDVEQLRDRFPEEKYQTLKRKHPKTNEEIKDWWVNNFTLEELKSLQVNQTSEGLFSRANFKIATFEEVLDLAYGLKKSTGREPGLYPEIKHSEWHEAETGYDFEEIFIDMVEDYYLPQGDEQPLLEKPLYVQAFSYGPEYQVVARSLRKLDRQMSPELREKTRLVQLDRGPNSNSRDDREDWMTRPENMKEMAQVADVIAPNRSRLLDPEEGQNFIRTARELGMDIHSWTFRAGSHPDESFEGFLARVLEKTKLEGELSLQGIITDHPDRVRDFLDASWQKRVNE